MLEPIKNINFTKAISIKKQNFNKNKTQSAPYQINSIYNNSNINFKGYFEPIKPYSFSQTLYDNYFQLPQIELINGDLYQLQGDKSQIDCAQKLYDGDSVVYCAPTGTGKTAVAHYAITKNLNEGKKTIYTTPLKALANDKYREFKKIYGEENVGILTGDNKENTNAPVQIMTAEIYNNQIPHLNPSSIGTVILDEVHYIGSYDRGNIWENSIINSSNKDIQMLALSATVGNSRELGAWMQEINSSRGMQKVEIDPTERFVPLIWHTHELNNTRQGAKDKSGKFSNIESYEVDLKQINPKNLTDKQKRAFELIYKVQNDYLGNVVLGDDVLEELAQKMLDKFASKMDFTIFDTEDFVDFMNKFYPEIGSEKIQEITELLLDRQSKVIKKIDTHHHDDDYPSLVEDLKRENLLPALVFKLSRSQTKKVIEALKEEHVDLTTEKEKEQIQEILDKYQQDNVYMGTNFDKKALLNGYAYHHAGELPQYRKLIEELFSKKLIKVVSATSTLSAGINMPAKTVVISDTTYQKFNPLTNEMETIPLSASDFHQMAGRAGRRGVDNLGHVVLYNLRTNSEKLKVKTNTNGNDKTEDKKIDELQLAYELLESGANDLKSRFGPEWTLLAQYYGENNNDEGLTKLINKSFRMYLSNDEEKEEKIILKNFMKYKATLEKLGFIETDSRGTTTINPKGEILTRSQCANPLLLAGLIYDEELKDVDIFGLSQIAGYIASSDVQEENEEIEDIIKDRFDLLACDSSKKSEQYSNFKEIKQKIDKYETTILRRENESRISKDKIVKSDSFGGFASCIWSILNDNENDSIKNFRGITGSLDKALNEQDIKKLGEASLLYNRKALEGNVYKILAQSVSILKQIDKICDFALENPAKYPNREYYLNLKETAQLALLLVKQKPIYDEAAL